VSARRIRERCLDGRKKERKKERKKRKKERKKKKYIFTKST
jgi:hypothetical protein